MDWVSQLSNIKEWGDMRSFLRYLEFHVIAPSMQASCAACEAEDCDVPEHRELLDERVGSVIKDPSKLPRSVVSKLVDNGKWPCHLYFLW